MGPNVKRLIAHKISIEAIPSGGGVSDGVAFILDRKRFAQVGKDSIKWVQDAILMVRNAGGPNPLRNADDETIAGELLKRINEKRKGESSEVSQ